MLKIDGTYKLTNTLDEDSVRYNKKEKMKWFCQKHLIKMTLI